MINKTISLGLKVKMCNNNSIRTFEKFQVLADLQGDEHNGDVTSQVHTDVAAQANIIAKTTGTIV